MNTPGIADSQSPAIHRSIALVGMMGAGKTTIGRRLARRLAMPFVDADDEIEVAAGCSIDEIFEIHGEAAFRDGERRVIARLLQQPAIVLATGGGAFLDPETRLRIRQTAVSVWLRSDIATLVRRVKRRRNRPLLKSADPEAVVERLVAERYPVYAQADIVVDSTDGPHGFVVETVIKKLNAYWAELTDPAHPKPASQAEP